MRRVSLTSSLPSVSKSACVSTRLAPAGVGSKAKLVKVSHRPLVVCCLNSNVAVKEEEEERKQKGLKATPLQQTNEPKEANDSIPFSLPWLGEEVEESTETSKDETETSDLSSYIAPISAVVVIGGAIGLSAYFKDDIKIFLDGFVDQVQHMGPMGYVAYAGLYVFLETFGVPATPLTLTAGYLFGAVPGTAVVSASSTVAAVFAFLIARYALRQKVLEMASNNKQFIAIDRAIKKDGFKFVFLLRLSPLLPFAASNYLYGLTSIETGTYCLASWLGMLPGTWAYVSAGSVSRNLLNGGSAGISPWQLALGVAVTGAVLWGAGSIAKNALDEVEREEAGGDM